MPKIYSEKDPLNLAKLRLANPVNVSGAHFIKTLAGDDPLYIQTPRCLVKQGFITAGKKTYCDLLFNNEDADFLAWLENLEGKVRAGLYENREKWFETKLDENDIENSTAPIYTHKGKFYVVRVNVPTLLGKISIKIFDENEREVLPEDIKENARVITVMEIQGIKCSVRGFQFEIELKQMLLVEPEKIFERCIIGKPIKIERTNLDETEEKEETPVVNKDKSDEVDAVAPAVVAPAVYSEPPIKEEEPMAEETKQSPIGDEVPIEIADFDLSLGNSSDPADEPIQLKKRDDVYYKLYKEERAKAKEAKQLALAHYLEAKRIKTTYLLEDMSDSDSEDDELM
jgi:hypothetical protein